MGCLGGAGWGKGELRCLGELEEGCHGHCEGGVVCDRGHSGNFEIRGLVERSQRGCGRFQEGSRGSEASILVVKTAEEVVVKVNQVFPDDFESGEIWFRR